MIKLNKLSSLNNITYSMGKPEHIALEVIMCQLMV